MAMLHSVGQRVRRGSPQREAASGGLGKFLISLQRGMCCRRSSISHLPSSISDCDVCLEVQQPQVVTLRPRESQGRGPQECGPTEATSVTTSLGKLASVCLSHSKFSKFPLFAGEIIPEWCQSKSCKVKAKDLRSCFRGKLVKLTFGDKTKPTSSLMLRLNLAEWGYWNPKSNRMH